MNWLIKIISKTLMTKISHISWGGYDKGFYGMSKWSSIMKCINFIYSRTIILINLSPIHSFIRILKLLYIISFLSLFSVRLVYGAYQSKLTCKTAGQYVCDNSLSTGTEIIQDLIMEVWICTLIILI